MPTSDIKQCTRCHMMVNLRFNRKVCNDCRISGLKANAKIYLMVNRAIRSGNLQRQSCEVCGVAKTDAHHDDYAKPLSVRWLCRLHHRQHHKQLQSA